MHSATQLRHNSFQQYDKTADLNTAGSRACAAACQEGYSQNQLREGRPLVIIRRNIARSTAEGSHLEEGFTHTVCYTVAIHHNDVDAD